MNPTIIKSFTQRIKTGRGRIDPTQRLNVLGRSWVYQNLIHIQFCSHDFLFSPFLHGCIECDCTRDWVNKLAPRQGVSTQLKIATSSLPVVPGETTSDAAIVSMLQNTTDSCTWYTGLVDLMTSSKKAWIWKKWNMGSKLEPCCLLAVTRTYHDSLLEALQRLHKSWYLIWLPFRWQPWKI